MTVADKLRVEDGHSPRAPARMGRRMRRAHDPPGFRRRGGRLRRQPQQQAGHAGSLRGQGQLAACNEIELPHLTPELQHHRAQRIAGKRISRRPQCAFRIEGAHRHQTTRIETEFGKPHHRQRARFDLAEILPHPYQRPPGRNPRRQARDESGRRSAVPACLREHLVHRPDSKPALERRIRLRMAERRPARRQSAAMGFNALDPAAQSRKRARACARHASPASFDPDAGRHWLLESLELALYPLICSRYVLV